MFFGYSLFYEVDFILKKMKHDKKKTSSQYRRKEKVEREGVLVFKKVFRLS